MKTTDYVLQILHNEGIRHLFLVPGGYIDPIITALKDAPEIQGIVAAHEGGAVMMADGYARASGKFAAAIGIGGPGITNMITGIATAYTDGIPLFIITGETKTAWEGRGAFQDSSSDGINDITMLEPVTVMKHSVSDVKAAPHHIKHLLHAMLNHAKRGPVHLSLPANIQMQEIDCKAEKLPTTLYHPRILESESFAQLWPLLQGQANVAILAGTGTIHSNASNHLLAVAEQFSIPVATTLGAKGIIPEDHPLSLGVFGWFGTRRANEVLLSKQIDVLIVLGSKLNQMETMGWTADLLPRHALIINDISESSWYPNYSPQLFVLGDNDTFLQGVINASEANRKSLTQTQTKRKQWLSDYIEQIPRYHDEENLQSDATPIHPTRVIHELRQVFPKDTLLYVGEGAHGFFAAHYWQSYAPLQYFTTIKYMSPMGWSIPAAIGGKLARPNQPVVSLTGDGSILMHGMEIQTAARYNIPVVFIVFNNKAHGNPQLRGKRVGKFECEFLSLPQHDWAKFAESLGAVGLTVTEPHQLKPAFEKALQMNKTVVIDILSGNYQTPTYIFDEYMYDLKSPIKRF